MSQNLFRKKRPAGSAVLFRPYPSANREHAQILVHRFVGNDTEARVAHQKGKAADDSGTTRGQRTRWWDIHTRITDVDEEPDVPGGGIRRLEACRKDGPLAIRQSAPLSKLRAPELLLIRVSDLPSSER